MAEAYEPTFEIVVRIPFEDGRKLMAELTKPVTLVVGAITFDAEIVHIQPWGKYNNAIQAGIAMLNETLGLKEEDA